MLRPRIIPCLLLQGKRLVKTRGFCEPKYVGDPINAVRIFNEKEVDELVVLDIDATVNGREPDYELLTAMAQECRMPLCYGGGVKTVEQIKRMVSLGIEKVAFSSGAIESRDLISAAAKVVGRQSVVVVMDVRKTMEGRYRIYTHNGTRETDLDLGEFAKEVEILGAGEVVVNSIDRDGEMAGYDLELAAQVHSAVSLPVTMLGGAGSQAHIAELIRTFRIVGAAAGSLFVFKGPYRAVLINYPHRGVKDDLIERALADSEPNDNLER